MSSLSNHPILSMALLVVLLHGQTAVEAQEGQGTGPTKWRTIDWNSKVTHVQPMTGIVLWTTNERVNDSPIQLEYSYMTYAQIVKADGSYDWGKLERLLEEVASRKHQLILRWHDTYVGQKTGIPVSITGLPNYQTTLGKSEKKPTEFPDWSHPALRKFILDFFTEFATRYDNDPRLAFVQAGFGLWAEYHIYDGPMQLGKTFPSQEYQSEFVKHLNGTLKQTPWMISIDAADNDRAPFEGNLDLLKLRFGLFDDSFNHKKHSKENEPNWRVLGIDRWKDSPTGGEFSFFEKVDQKKALDTNGPHGTPFELHAKKFGISFMIGDAQPNYQKPDRIQSASLACGYRFQLTQLESNGASARMSFKNTGIAPIYYDAFPSIDGIRSAVSLKSLLPGESRQFEISKGLKSQADSETKLSIDCDRLVPGQSIEFDTASR